MRNFLAGMVVSGAVSFGILVSAAETSAQKFSYDFTKRQETKTGFTQQWAGAEENGWITGFNGATRNGAGLDKLLTYKDLALPAKFTVAADVKIETADGAHFAGVAFNIQDAKNFYVFRVNSGSGNGICQVLKMVNGEWKDIKTMNFDAVKAGTAYTLSVQATAPGAFTVSIRKGEEVVLKPESLNDANAPAYQGGSAGIYMGAAECSITGFSVEAAAAK